MYYTLKTCLEVTGIHDEELSWNGSDSIIFAAIGDGKKHPEVSTPSSYRAWQASLLTDAQWRCWARYLAFEYALDPGDYNGEIIANAVGAFWHRYLPPKDLRLFKTGVWPTE